MSRISSENNNNIATADEERQPLLFSDAEENKTRSRSQQNPSHSRPNIQQQSDVRFLNEDDDDEKENNNHNTKKITSRYLNPKPTVYDLQQLEQRDTATRTTKNIEDEANIFSSMTFTWFSQIMTKSIEGTLPRGEIMPASAQNSTAKVARDVEDGLYFEQLEKEKTWEDFFTTSTGGSVDPLKPYVGVCLKKGKNKNIHNDEKKKNGGVVLWIGKLLQDEPDHTISKFSLGPSGMRAAVQWFGVDDDGQKNKNNEKSKLSIKNNNNNNNSYGAVAVQIDGNKNEEELDDFDYDSPVPPELVVSQKDGKVNGEDLVGMLAPLISATSDSKPDITLEAIENIELDFSFKPPPSFNNNANIKTLASSSTKKSKKNEQDIMFRRQSSSGIISSTPDDGDDDDNKNNNSKSNPSTSSSAKKQNPRDDPKSYPHPTKASMFWMITKPHIMDYLLQVIPLRLLAEAANLSSPYLLELYVDYLHTDEATHPDLWKRGVVIASGLAFVYFVFSITSQKWFQVAMRAGLKVRSALMLIILHKALCLSPHAQAHPSLSVGKCVTLFGNDVVRVADAFGFFVYLVSMPIQLAVTIFLLYRLIGWVAFVALGATLIFIPLSGWMMKKNGEQRAKMSSATDQRAKLTTELFSSFKVIKCMGWEENFLKRLCDTRDTELDFLGEMQKYRVASSFLMNAAPAVVVAVSLVTYHVIGHSLTPVVIFPVMALLNILRVFSMILPYTFQVIVDVNVSLKRMRIFLTAEDMVPVVTLLQEDEARKKEQSSSRKNEETKNNNNNLNTLLPVHHSSQQQKNPGIITNNVSVTCFEGRDLTKEIKEGFGKQLKKWNQRQRENRGNGSCLCGGGCCIRCCGSLPGDGDFLMSVEDENVTSKDDKKKPTNTEQEEKNDKNNNDVKKRIMNASKTIEGIGACKEILSNISISIPKGSLVIVIGPTGSGKSILLETLLSLTHATPSSNNAQQKNNEDTDKPLISFHVKDTKKNPSIAYFPQTPFLFNASVKENIIFFADDDQNDDNSSGNEIEDRDKKFNEAVNSCALGPDLEVFPNGIETMVGSSNLVVSGGQRARIALARCVYANSDFYFMDDPLAALDAHVGESVFKNCICGTLKSKTRILVTHHLHFLPYANHIIQLEDGRVSFAGDYAEYSEKIKSGMIQDVSSFEKSCSTSNFASAPSLLTSALATSSGQHNSNNNKQPQFPDLSKNDEDQEEHNGSHMKRFASSTLSVNEADHVPDSKNSKSNNNNSKKTKSGLHQEPEKEAEKTPVKPVVEAAPKKPETEEEMSSGEIKNETYFSYFHAAGGATKMIVILVWYFVTECMNQAQIIWLTFWASDLFKFKHESTYLYVYVGVVCLGFVSAASRAWLMLETGRVASRALHFELLTSLISAKSKFFDITPLGTVLNRFSSDLDQIDIQVPMDLMSLLAIIFSIISTLVIMVASTPIIIVTLIPIWIIYFRVMKFFNSSVRGIKRIDSVNKSPIFAMVAEVIEGAKTILAFDKAVAILKKAAKRIDAYFSTSYALQLTTRWLGVRLELLGNATIAAIAFGGVLTKTFPSHTTAVNSQEALVGLLSLGLTISMQIVGLMNYLVRMRALVEADFNAVERIGTYSNEVELEPVLNSKMVPSRYIEMFEDVQSRRKVHQETLMAKNEEKVKEMIKQNPDQRTQDDALANLPQEVEDSLELNERIRRKYQIQQQQNNSSLHQSSSSGLCIRLQNVSMRYRPELPLVLKNVSFEIPAGCKIAFCGRSGAAKSSILNVFLRLNDIDHGKMLVDDDGKDALHDLTIPELRRNFATITQDATLFMGTIRSNLDPFNTSTDEEIEKAIEMVGMTERIFYPNINNNAVSSANFNSHQQQQQEKKQSIENKNDDDDDDDDDENDEEETEQQNGQLKKNVGIDDAFAVDDHASPENFEYPNNVNPLVMTPTEANETKNKDDDDDDNNQNVSVLPPTTNTNFLNRTRLPLKDALLQPVSDGAKNFSLGQRQLLCLARALLRKNARAILLDEASASVSQASDELIQKTIRTAFADRTCVFVAHRLTTIAHVDKVIMMDKGRVVEVGSPKELMKRTKDGKFFKLVSSQGKKGRKDFEKALEKYGAAE